MDFDGISKKVKFDILSVKYNEVVCSRLLDLVNKHMIQSRL